MFILEESLGFLHLRPLSHFFVPSLKAMSKYIPIRRPRASKHNLQNLSSMHVQLSPETQVHSEQDLQWQVGAGRAAQQIREGAERGNVYDAFSFGTGSTSEGSPSQCSQLSSISSSAPALNPAAKTLPLKPLLF